MIKEKWKEKDIKSCDGSFFDYPTIVLYSIIELSNWALNDQSLIDTELNIG